jgi:hypothetical protein
MRQYLSRDKLKIQYTNYTVLTNLMSEEKKKRFHSRRQSSTCHIAQFTLYRIKININIRLSNIT